MNRMPKGPIAPDMLIYYPAVTADGIVTNASAFLQIVCKRLADPIFRPV